MDDIKTKLAGKFMALQSNDLFQESLEGIGAGAMAGMGMLGTGIPIEQVALQTASAMGFGVGIGLLGKNIGARIGKALHPQALKNQDGVLATLGRTGGQKTLVSGAAETMRYGKGQIKQELRTQTTKELLNEALQSPQNFASKYGVDPETFKQYHKAVGVSGQVRAGLETLENLSPEQRQQLGSSAKELMNQGFNQVENLINVHAAARMDANLAKMALSQKGKTFPGTNMDIGESFEHLLKDPTAITGEHVGRLAGRFIGDEIGVATGVGVGGMLAGAMGIKTDKDKEIEKLKNQLSYGY